MSKHYLAAIVASVVLSTSSSVLAADATNGPYQLAGNWPTHYVFSDGTDFGLAGKYQYDLNHFSNDGGALDDSHTNRRREAGLFLQKKGAYDAIAIYDYESKTWQDAFVRVQTKALTGTDAGALRGGFSKTPVGFEGNTSSGATTFLEVALPTQAIYANRRLGVDWALQRPNFLLNVGYYHGGDLNGDSDGTTAGGRAAWLPLNEPGKVIHLGVSDSRENPTWTTDGRGLDTAPSVRLRARPEAGLTSARLVDSGALNAVDHIDRRGLEALWIGGPWSLQAEYLDATVKHTDGKPAYHANGYYGFISWVLSGESRSYSGGNVGDVKPTKAFGAVELALRYSEVDLNDGLVQGGRERNWTLGANWYVNRHLKLQANYVRANSDRRGIQLDPNVFELRAQISL